MNSIHLISDPVCIWMTGLSGAGKTTLSVRLAAHLRETGITPIILDGDQLRAGLCSDLRFDRDSRRENARRSAEVASLVLNQGYTAIVSMITPYQADRDLARDIIGSRQFLEVFVHAPLEICAERDVKGLYKAAREGKIAQFTGISSTYETPDKPDLIVDTTASINDALQHLTDYISDRNPRIPADQA